VSGSGPTAPTIEEGTCAGVAHTANRERKLLKKIEQSIAPPSTRRLWLLRRDWRADRRRTLAGAATATLSLEAQQRRELKQKMFGD